MTTLSSSPFDLAVIINSWPITSIMLERVIRAIKKKKKKRESCGEEGKGERRKDEMGEGPDPSRRKEMKLYGKDDDHHESEPEDRHGEPEEGQNHHRIIEKAVVANRGKNACGYAQEAGDCRGDDCQKKGIRKTAPDFGGHGLAGAGRLTQVQPRQIRKEYPVLDIERLIQSQLGADRFDRLLGGHLSCNYLSRISRKGPEEQEDDQGDPDQDRKRGEKALNDVSKHFTLIVRKTHDTDMENSRYRRNLHTSVCSNNRLLKKSFSAGCSKMPRCKAPEILRNEATSTVGTAMTKDEGNAADGRFSAA